VALDLLRGVLELDAERVVIGVGDERGFQSAVEAVASNATSLATTARASLAVRTGMRPIAICGMPLSLKSTNQSSDAVLRTEMSTSFVGT
jgi:hypothetical protein